ncbi:hypothetical protein [Bifidobacterium moukalabense]|nr:hypothetical protein [Bifidobacterium moukalabense]
MATNVSEKDKTLNEIIEYCEAKSREEQNYARTVLNDIAKGWALAGARTYDRIAKHCESMLGYSGSMPSEVPNQSEDAK